MPVEINAQTAEKMNQLIGYIAESIRDGGDAIKQQAPEVAREIVWFGIVDNATSIAFGLCVTGTIFVVCFRYLIRYIRSLKNDYTEIDPLVAILCPAILLISFFVGMVILTTHFSPLVKAIATPRLYVLDYLRR